MRPLSPRAVLLFLLAGCALENRRLPVQATAATGPSVSFVKVKALLTERCQHCHTAYGRYEEPDFLRDRLVAVGDPEHSPLFARLRGANGGGNEDMPPDKPLNASEVSLVRGWIAGLRSTGGDAAADRTRAALAVLAVACFRCHGAEQTARSDLYSGSTVPAFSAFTSDNDFVVSGLVVPKSLDDSWLYLALAAFNSMPKDSPALDAASKAALEQWIGRMGDL